VSAKHEPDTAARCNCQRSGNPIHPEGVPCRCAHRLFPLLAVVVFYHSPVVPKKGNEINRFQISADHTPADIDAVLDTLARFKG
jgi:7-keto-8-aminopelargonate synthetase-like enzyme